MIRKWIKAEVEKEIARVLRQPLIEVTIMVSKIEKLESKQKERVADLDKWALSIEKDLDDWKKIEAGRSLSLSDHVRQHSNQVEQYLKGFNLLLEKLK